MTLKGKKKNILFKTYQFFKTKNKNKRIISNDFLFSKCFINYLKICTIFFWYTKLYKKNQVFFKQKKFHHKNSIYAIFVKKKNAFIGKDYAV